MSANRPVSLAPSILAADFTRLGEQLADIERGGVADRIHVDIMDGHFVPPISFGAMVCAAAHRATRLPLDVHLMVECPSNYYEEVARAGAHTVTVHIEACPHIHRDLLAIKALGMRAGIALNPGTALGSIDEILDLADLVLVMTVNPGWGGQQYLTTSAARVNRMRCTLDERNLAAVDLEVDGGINVTTAGEVTSAGANVLVAGSAAFGHPAGVAAGLAAIRDAIG